MIVFLRRTAFFGFCALLMGAFVLGVISPMAATAQPSRDEDYLGPVDLGDEYSDYAKPVPGRSSGGGGSSVGMKILLWIPNRLLDVVDIFRADVGVGPANGAVLRLTQWGQAGGRFFNPGSLRLGMFGRDWPVMWEEHDEYGVGPGFIKSKERRIGKYEFGLGADLLIAGAYLGIRFDEVADFLVGIAGFDILDDDLS